MRKACAVVSHVFNPHVKANNKYMNSHNAETNHQNISCVDANHLYRWAMSQHLPTSSFK